MFTFISNKFNHKTQGTEGRKSEGIRGSQRIQVIWDTIYINVLSSFFATVIGVVIYNYTSAGYTTYACARTTVVCITILVPVAVSGCVSHPAA